MAVYLGISALLSHFLYTTNSGVFHEEYRETKTENGQNLLAHKSSYNAADINFSAYIADRDPYWELEKSICRNYRYDKELLAHIGKIHEAVDGFLTIREYISHKKTRRTLLSFISWCMRKPRSTCIILMMRTSLFLENSKIF